MIDCGHIAQGRTLM